MKKPVILTVILVSFAMASCSPDYRKKDSGNSGVKSVNTAASKGNNTDEDKKAFTEADLNNYISTIKPQGMETTQVLQEDIDSDGNTEVLVSFGQKSEIDKTLAFAKNYVLRFTGGSFKNIGEIKGTSFQVFDIKIVKLDSSEKKYIYASQTNGMNGIGWIIFGLKGDEIAALDSDFPPTGDGVNTLIDDGIGKYKRVDYKEYKDIQVHRVTTNYSWNGSTFIKSGREISYPNSKENSFVYPQDAEKVIQCYIEAVYLNVDEEIKELISKEEVKNFKVLDYFGEGGLFEYGLASYLQHETISKDENTAVIKTSDIFNNKFAYFKLIKDSGRWKIDDISETAID